MTEKMTDEWIEKCKKQLTKEEADEIREMYNGKYMQPTQEELAEEFDVTQATISKIVNGIWWSDD